MRPFLIGMCDIFLLLYLTAITTYQPGTALTVEDFYKLKSMYTVIEQDKKKSEAELAEKLRRALGEKETLASQLTQEKGKLKETKQSLVTSDAEKERINEDLKKKEEMLHNKEQQLAGLNKEIEAKEKTQREMQQAIEETRKLADEMTLKASTAQQLANQMQKEASQANEAAEAAKAAQEKALIVKEQALKDKADAEQKTAQALAARTTAETEKEKALAAMETAQLSRAQAEKDAQKLAQTIQDIKQQGDAAYKENILPRIVKLNITYETRAGDTVSRYERELDLLPLKIDGKTFVVFPFRQIGFYSHSDAAPDKLQIMYKDKKITSALINKKDDLIAIFLPEVKTEAMAPYPADTNIAELMPTLLTLRNGGNVGLMDKIRGISEDYFIVNRDFLEAQKEGGIKFTMTGFRGTGTRADRIVLGDQLVDLNGRLIGVANSVNQIVRVDTFQGWEEISF